MKESGQMIKQMDMELIIMLTELFIVDNGKMICKMDKDMRNG